MKQGKYLNVILTINAALLTGLLWTQVADEPVLVRDAAAQARLSTPRTNRTSRTTGPFVFPNAAEQRRRIEMAVGSLEKLVAEQYRFMQSGQLQVEVSNLDEIELVIEQQ